MLFLIYYVLFWEPILILILITVRKSRPNTNPNPNIDRNFQHFASLKISRFFFQSRDVEFDHEKN